jgi:hypothetical protein
MSNTLDSLLYIRENKFKYVTFKNQVLFKSEFEKQSMDLE